MENDDPTDEIRRLNTSSTVDLLKRLANRGGGAAVRLEGSS